MACRVSESSAGLGKTSGFLKLNIGGSSYKMSAGRILKRSKASLIYRFLCLSHKERLNLCDAYIEKSDEYFFERSAFLFEMIYFYYTTGECHKPSRPICFELLMGELAFWNLTRPFISQNCCFKGYERNVVRRRAVVSATDEFFTLRCGRLRRNIWYLFEVPESSWIARSFSFFCIILVLLSNVLLVVGSLPSCQIGVNQTLPSGKLIVINKPLPIFDLLECICVIWFSIEYLSKLLVAPNRTKVFFKTLNIIDLIAIVPFYFELALRSFGYYEANLEELTGALLVARILRVLRVIRIFKLVRYSSGLRLFAKTMNDSKEQLGTLTMIMVTASVFFSTLMYFLEKEEPVTQFTSIPAAFWWAIVTMTTVGYGDMAPTTIGGKLVATCAISCGIIILALPITILVDNFIKVQEKDQLIPLKHPLLRSNRHSVSAACEDD